MGRHRRGRLAVHFVIVAGLCALVSAVGCRAAKRAVNELDPTGVLAETAARKNTWDAIRARADELDTRAFNSAVGELERSLRLLSERIEALSPEAITSIQDRVRAGSATFEAKLAATDFAGTAAAIARAAETLDARTQALGAGGEAALESINTLVEQSSRAVVELSETVSILRDRLEQVTADTQEMIRQATETVRALPTEQVDRTLQQIDDAVGLVRAAASKWPATTNRLDEAIGSLRTTLRVVTATFLVLGGCAAVWLVRFLRARP